MEHRHGVVNSLLQHLIVEVDLVLYVINGLALLEKMIMDALLGQLKKKAEKN